MQNGAEYFRITEYEMKPGVTNIEVNNPVSYTLGFGDPEWGPMGESNDI